jgi:murein DD-endopeptidase MepM/ murein hydrolase activator NlpD
MLEASQIPAELRMNRLMAKLSEPEVDPSNFGHNNSGVQQGLDPNSFKAMVSLMQTQMLGEALVNPNDKDSSNPLSGFMGQTGMNLMMMGSIQGTNTQMNPMLLQMMMQQQGAGMMNPMMPMMMGMPAINNQAMPFGTQQEMVFPVKGRISSEYGHRHHPISGHSHFHSGVDIAAPKGSPIRMPYDGKVVHVGYVAGFGDNTVIVAHENQIQSDGKILYSVFGHNEYAFVKEGEYIKAGEIFATVGSEGNSTGPHLHWETRVAPSGLSGTKLFERNLSMTIDPMSLA